MGKIKFEWKVYNNRIVQLVYKDYVATVFIHTKPTIWRISKNSTLIDICMYYPPRYGELSARKQVETVMEHLIKMENNNKDKETELHESFYETINATDQEAKEVVSDMFYGIKTDIAFAKLSQENPTME